MQKRKGLNMTRKQVNNAQEQRPTGATPTPWTFRPEDHFLIHGPFIDRESLCLAEVYEGTNAAFIVRAVNGYDALKAVNEELVEHLKTLINVVKVSSTVPDWAKRVAQEASATITKAEGNV
jgi:hypothetical protein